MVDGEHGCTHVVAYHIPMALLIDPPSHWLETPQLVAWLTQLWAAGAINHCESEEPPIEIQPEHT